jgi:phosphoglucosamine mutase
MSGSRLFGTDGIRAPFGTPPLVAPTVQRLGRLLAAELAVDRAKPRVVLGGDTRASTSTLCGWLAAGLAAGGASVAHAGVVPTPAVALLTRDLGAAAGIAVSASHNLPPDNGIKLVGSDGFKWPVAREAALEGRLLADGDPVDGAGDRPASALPAVDVALAARYLAALRAALPAGRPLAGMRIALDCANGAAAAYAADLFSALGAETLVSHDRPDGHNINRDCGSTHPGAVAAQARAAGADLGVAFDGDADRAILVDERGEVADGDALLYVWASALHDLDALPGNRIVATSMSNLGLEVALARRGVGIVRCDVGDRVVVETMRGQGIRLGGEQSGHLVDLALATTGDGMLTALQIAHVVARSGQPLSALRQGFVRFPQLLRNLRVPRKPPLASLPTVITVAADVESRLGREGRLVLRYSGTEPLCRIMLEGPDAATIEAMADEIAAAIERDLRA